MQYLKLLSRISKDADNHTHSISTRYLQNSDKQPITVLLLVSISYPYFRVADKSAEY